MKSPHKKRKFGSSPLQKWYEPYVFLGPAVLLLLGVTIYPLLYSLYMSFHFVHIAKMHRGTPFVGFANYYQVFKDPLFWTSLKNSAIFTFSGVALEFFFGLSLALIVDRLTRGKAAIIRTILLLPMVIAPVVVALIWRFMYNTDFGIINYVMMFLGIEKQAWLADLRLVMPAVIAMDVWQWTPFMFLIILAGLKSLPDTPYEAASIDGATPFQAFCYITLPLLRPIILVGLLLRLIDSIKTFDNVFILTGGGPGSQTELLSLYIYRIGFRHFNIGYGGALSYVLLILVVVLSKVLINALKESQADIREVV